MLGIMLKSLRHHLIQSSQPPGEVLLAFPKKWYFGGVSCPRSCGWNLAVKVMSTCGGWWELIVVEVSQRNHGGLHPSVLTRETTIAPNYRNLLWAGEIYLHELLGGEEDPIWGWGGDGLWEAVHLCNGLQRCACHCFNSCATLSKAFSSLWAPEFPSVKWGVDLAGSYTQIPVGTRQVRLKLRPVRGGNYGHLLFSAGQLIPCRVPG